MQYVLAAIFLVSLIIFIDVQKYLANPDRHKVRDEWFAKFAEFNRERQSDPALAWRLSAIENAFHKNR